MALKRNSVNSKGELVKTVAFQAVLMYDKEANRQFIVLYSLGADGILREYTAKGWKPFPVSGEYRE